MGCHFRGMGLGREVKKNGSGYGMDGQFILAVGGDKVILSCSLGDWIRCWDKNVLGGVNVLIRLVEERRRGEVCVGRVDRCE